MVEILVMMPFLNLISASLVSICVYFEEWSAAAFCFSFSTFMILERIILLLRSRL